MNADTSTKKLPFIIKPALDAIITEHPTPFHIYSEDAIRGNARLLRRAFSWNPGFREYFAVKATPTPAILRILREEGCGADCSSFTELMLAEAVGMTGGDIMFSSNVTPRDEYQLAARLGATINLDDITHIDFLSDICPVMPETICCRYNPGGYFVAGNGIMDNPGEAKFGFTRPQIFEGFARLKRLGVKHFGVHAFLASNTLGEEYYPELARVLFQLAIELKRELGTDISFINLSGGIGVAYRPEDTPPDILKIGEGVEHTYRETLSSAGMDGIAIYTELGRYMLADCGGLVTTVLHEKHTHKDYIGVDACAVNLMRPAIYKAYHHITVMGKENAQPVKTYDITGSLCENNDKFAVDRKLPEISPGDILWIHDTGAHGFSMGYNYNGKLRSAELLHRSDGRTELIRRAETPRDYFATLAASDHELLEVIERRA